MQCGLIACERAVAPERGMGQPGGGVKAQGVAGLCPPLPSESDGDKEFAATLDFCAVSDAGTHGGAWPMPRSLLVSGLWYVSLARRPGAACVVVVAGQGAIAMYRVLGRGTLAALYSTCEGPVKAILPQQHLHTRFLCAVVRWPVRGR
ncbi:hypothetical protein Vretimale_18064 [Volvox reticuliferus]|nr:hypothetical protein Vretimale_18064 [Volvox reticuliferus]